MGRGGRREDGEMWVGGRARKGRGRRGGSIEEKGVEGENALYKGCGEKRAVERR